MADFIPDGPNKIIQEPPGSGDTTFEVNRDLYSAWKRWVQTGDGDQYLPAFTVEGGTPIGATGLFTGTTFILINGWKVRAASHDHQLLLNGNIYSDDGIVTVSPVSGNTNVLINSSVAAQGIQLSNPNVVSTIDSDDISNIAQEVWNEVIDTDRSQSAREKLRAIRTKTQDLAFE